MQAAIETEEYSVRVCKDLDYIRSVLLDPEMWERCTDDYADESIIDKASCIWLICYYYDAPMGLASVRSESSSVVNVHIYIPKSNRGLHTKLIGFEILRWIKMNAKSHIHKVNTKIPVIYKDVIRFAHSLGFKDEGIDRLSMMKNGVLIDRLNLGMSLGDIV
jgi:hypothetical protein